MAQAKSPQKELTGRHVLLILLAFFGVMFAVNAYFTVVAVKSFRGEDVKGSYRQGLEYNQTLDARSQQAALGWDAHVNVVRENATRHTVIVQINQSQTPNVTLLTLSGLLRHPVDMEKDVELTFSDMGAGKYSAEIEGISGQWTLLASAQNADDTFKFESELWIK